MAYIYDDDRLQFMSRDDALNLDGALDSGDVSLAWMVWSSAVEAAGQLEDWFRSWVPDSVFSAEGGRSSVEAWYTTALDIEEVLSGNVDSHVHHFVADVVKSFDTVDGSVSDLVLSRSGLLAWFRRAYFEFHSHVRLRFKLAIGLGQPWTRDGGIPQKMSFEHDVYCCIVFALVGIWGRRRGFSLNCMLTISSVFLGILGSSCVLRGLLLGMLGLLVRSLLLVSVCI